MDELYSYINESGIIVPNTDVVLSEVQSYWRNLFGQQLSIEASTPQGRIIETEAVIRKGTLGVCALIANQLNPNVATGTFLDAQGAFFGLNRTTSKNSIINNVLMTGTPLSYPTSIITVANNPTSGDILTVRYTLSGAITATVDFIFGTDIAIGSSISITATNIKNSISGNTTLNTLMTATVSSNAITLTASTLPTLSSLNAISSIYSPLGTSSSSNITTTSELNYCYIPSGSMAITANGDTFVLSSSVLLASNGQAFGTFVAQDSGAITVAVGELNVIGTQISGWETVYNDSIAQIGYDAQPDDLFRTYIQNSKMVNSTSMVDSLISELSSINGLQDAKIIENYTSVTQTNASNAQIPVGETIPSHSIMLVVQGANSTGNFDTLVAEAMLIKRSVGCGMAAVSNTSNVRNITLDDNGIGSYTMTFNYASSVPIYVYIEVVNNGFSGDINTAIKNILQNWFAGNTSQITATNFIKIGKNVSAFEMSSVIMQNLSVYIPKCYIGTSPSPSSSDEIDINNIQIATIADSNITVNLLS